jgi:hypothetical protein
MEGDMMSGPMETGKKRSLVTPRFTRNWRRQFFAVPKDLDQ